MSAGEQAVYEVTADEAGRAGDQNSHEFSLRRHVFAATV